MNKNILWSAVVLTIVFSSCNNMNKDNNHRAERLDLKEFFKNPNKSAYKISPDGKQFAFMAPYENRMNVFVQTIGADSARRLTSEKSRDLAGYFWKGSSHILFMKDAGGDENFALYSVHIDSSKTKALTAIAKVKTNIIDDLEDHPTEVIVGLNKRDPKIFDAFRLNIITGEMKMIAQNPGNISGWMTDHDGKLRVAMVTNGVESSILYRATETDTFKIVLTTNFKESFNPQFFDFQDSSVVYGTSNLNRDKAALVRFDMEKGAEIEKIFENEDYDIGGAAYSKKRRVLTSVFWSGEKSERATLDVRTKEIYDDLATKLPGVEIYLTSADKAEENYIVRTMSDRTMGSYYIYQAGSRTLATITDISPWLKPENMAEMTPIKYVSRDGQTIHGYLTLPVGVDPTNLPVIINPHGGPWARDNWGFNREVQFLANRGYAVLQMNFRGSTGYGRAFWEASFKQWGQAMQNDISDGVKWLVEQKIADPNRIAIYGASYGGYATLAGVTFTPDLYTCAIDYVGVSNLFTFMETVPPYWTQYLAMLHEMVGDPVKDKAMLAAYSPALHADQIKTPLFIAQGANDQRVKKSESDQMVKALQDRGVVVEYMVKDNEGHGFHNEENRYEFYAAMEAFLNKHMALDVDE
ncbi:MAG: dipeptidyl aminopeptidase/acylaminoacyl peptidase [Bacteroidia bacterium]|jgi:dipeptidyl aminopeptidase/acylaminoacyl peptidase